MQNKPLLWGGNHNYATAKLSYDQLQREIERAVDGAKVIRGGLSRDWASDALAFNSVDSSTRVFIWGADFFRSIR